MLTTNAVNWNADGEAYFFQDQHKIILDSGVPGDVITVEIIKKGINTSFGKVMEIIQPSEYRSGVALCDNHHCPGCPLKAADYDYQVKWKEQQLSILFDLPAQFVSTGSIKYRNKIILPVEFNTALQRYQAGLYQKNTHDVSSWNYSCTICLPEISDLIQHIISQLNDHYINTHQVLPVSRIFLRGSSESGFQCGIVFSNSDELIKMFCNILKNSTDLIQSLFYEINSTKGNSVLIKEPVFVTKQETINLQLNAKTYQTGPETFFQTNQAATGQIIAEMNKYLPSEQELTVFDICSGLGVLSAGLTGSFRRFCFESNANSFKYIPAADYLNSSFIQADMAELDLSLYPDPDVIILDPPRKGVDRQLLKKINQSKAKVIFYLSCNPQTQKKDLTHLDQYRLHQLIGFDMFPQTPHIESLAILIK